jgi:hypothetical protein
MNNESFVYCWTDHKTNKLYVGVHKGTQTDGYVCSSKKMLEEYNTRPHDFSRQIIANGPYQEMISLETAILRAANASKNPDFYNKHNNNGRVPKDNLSEDHKDKIRKGVLNNKTFISNLKERSKTSKYHLGHKHSDLSKISIKMNNPNRKSFVTPDGVFMSGEDYATLTQKLTANGIRNILKERHKLITKARVNKNILFTMSDVGKTPFQLGYKYENEL